MRVLTGGALTALLLLAISGSAVAAGNGTGTATIIQPLTVTANSTLRFGTLIRPASGSGTATISTAGALTTGGGNPPTSVASSAHGNADFTVSGEGGQSITVTVDPSFNMSGPSASILTVTTTASNTGVQTLSGSLGASGSLDVPVGGSITITSTTTTGAYTGTFNVSAAYN
jgi:hypothetical protein